MKEINKEQKLKLLGKEVLKTNLCYWEYEYNDGDCHFIDCLLDEVCKLRNEILKGDKK